MPGTTIPSSPQPRSRSHSRSQSTPFAPMATFDEYKQKQREDEKWKVAWQEYEERKTSTYSASWAEYHQQEAKYAAQWKEYEATKKEMFAKLADMELKGERPKGAFPPVDPRSVAENHPPRSTPLAPKPIYAHHSAASSSSYIPMSRTKSSSGSSRSSSIATPPPQIFRVSTPASPASSRSVASTPPRTPTSSGFRPSSRQSTMSPAPPWFSSSGSAFTPISRSATPSQHSAASPLLKSATLSASSGFAHTRTRSNTNPSAPKPQIFMPKPVHASDNEAPMSKSDELLAEEMRRRIADEQRRINQATEHARQRALAEEAERRLHEAAEALRNSQARRSAASSSKRRAEAGQKAALEQEALIRLAWETYEEGWKKLLDGSCPGDDEGMSFRDVPWPVVGDVRSAKELDSSRFEAFFYCGETIPGGSAKVTKQRIRDAILRFHPDRFEGRWMTAVRPSDRTAVKEGVGLVMRFLNDYSARLA